MKKKKLLIAFFGCGLLIAGLLVGLYALPVSTCCISGIYEGTSRSNVLPNCPPPTAEKFKMEIKQVPACDSAIFGTVTDASGNVNNFRGTVSRGLRGCCNIEGRMINRSGNEIFFKGTLCRVGGRWSGKGVYKEPQSPDPCKKEGTWNMAELQKLVPAEQ